MQPPALRLELVPVEAGGLGAFEDEWRRLEDEAPEAEPYATFDWLAAWVEAYEPQRLSVLRGHGDGRVVALGLLEHASGGRWYFGGRPVTNFRGPLCRPEDELAVWRAVGDWVGEAPNGCALLSAEGLSAQAAGELARTRLTPATFRVLELPGSFQTFLSDRSSSTRKTFRQRMRGVERAGGNVAEADDVAAALQTFLRLHGERAASKGERHEAVDERLARMLERVSGSSLRLRVWQLLLEGRAVAVSIHLERGQTVYFYNTGMDSAAAKLGPGIVLELELIRDAIERGLRRIDLGPGDLSYKARFGGEPVERFIVAIPAPTAKGRAVELAVAARGLLRSRGGG
jgi:CelD/BcsL family acetyltransferase involved in cellulose biosynthesis